MANDAYYDVEFVAKDKAVLERIQKIMNYEDGEYFIYRVFRAEFDEIETFGDTGLYTMRAYGDVAWGINAWFEDNENPRDIYKETGAHYTTLTALSEKLGFGAEAWCEEPGCAFQQHYACTHGNLSRAEACDWYDPCGTHDLDDMKGMEADVREMFELTEEDENEIKEIYKIFEETGYGIICCGGFDWDNSSPTDIWSGDVPMAEKLGVHTRD